MFSAPVIITPLNEIYLTTGSTSSINKLIGASFIYFSDESTNYTSPGIINLSGVPVVHIDSDTLASSHSLNSLGQTTSTLAVIGIESAYGTVEHWHSNQHLLSYVDFKSDTRALSTIDIQLRDHTGNILTLPANAEVILELMVVFKS